MLGWPVLVHYCHTCSYNTPVEYSAAVWTAEHTCTHCGTKAAGADFAGQSKGSMNTYQQDELAQLFSHLSTQPQQQQLQAADVQQPQYEGQAQTIVEQLPVNPEKSDAPLTFASAHYTGTPYIRAETQSEPSRSPPPPYNESLLPEAMAETLRQNSIDPSSLLPNQIELFTNADYEQRLRLLELWRISPPSYPLEQHMNNQWASTSLQREEAEARVRYEQHMQARDEQSMIQAYMAEPMSPIRQPGEAAWPPAARMRAASIAAGRGPTSSKPEIEPYMSQGYEHHSDPVYANAGCLWVPSSPNGNMADQYGMYEQIRNHADWERMNQQDHARQMGDDDTMMM